MSARADVLYTLVGQVAWAVSLFAVGVFAARLLGPGPRGEAYLALLFPTIGSLIATLGLPFTFTHRLTRRPEELRSALSLSAGLAVATTAVSVLAASLLARPIGAILSVGADLVAAAILITPLLLFVLLLLATLSAIDRFRARAGVVIAQGLAYLLVTLVLLVSNGSAMSVIVGQGVAAAVAAVSALIVLVPIAAHTPHHEATWPMRSWLGFGLKGHPGQVGQLLNYRLDALILGAFHGPVAVGFYAVATSLAEITSYGGTAVAIAAGPRAVRADGRAVLLRYTRITVVATVIVAIALGIAAPVIVPLLYGEEFRASVVPLMLLLPGIVALVYVKLLAVGVVAEGRPDLVSLGLGASLVATLIADFALIPPFGATGAAAASTLAYAIGAASLAASYVRTAGVTPASLVPRAADVRGMAGLLRR